MPAPDLPAKTLEVRALDENGRPLPKVEVQLGTASQSGDGKLQITRVVTNAEGVARFTGLASGSNVGYAAVVDYHGTRLGTQPFTMPETGGVRADIRALQRTSDPSIISLGSGGRIVVQMHDELLQITEMLPIENRTDKLFDPGPGGVEIPLPRGFVNAEVGEAERGKLEVRKNYGIAVHGPLRADARNQRSRQRDRLRVHRPLARRHARLSADHAERPRPDGADHRAGGQPERRGSRHRRAARSAS